MRKLKWRSRPALPRAALGAWLALWHGGLALAQAASPAAAAPGGDTIGEAVLSPMPDSAAADAAPIFRAGLAAASRGDAAAAARAYRAAADLGYAPAQTALGAMHDRHGGGALDFREAARLYRLAANQGDAWAQASLGRLHANGQGVRRDLVEAYSWFLIAERSAAMDAGLRDQVGHWRRRVAGQITPQAVALARRRADAFQPVAAN